MRHFISLLERLESRRLLASSASISGVVFADHNGNGRLDSGEAGIGNIVVYIDANNNRKLDPGERKTTTAANGDYSFGSLAAGTYIIRQILPGASTQTLPTQNFGQHVTLKSGQKVSGKDFGDASQQIWSEFGGNAQHTALSSVASQDLTKLKWHTSVDLDPQMDGDELLIHYGSPVITAKNTVIVPVKTGASGDFRIEAHRGSDGKLLWEQSSDYVLPPHTWTPQFGPAVDANGRVYMPGPGGTVYYRDDADSTTGASGQIAFYGLSNYTANKADLDSTVFVDTPITIDSAGNLYFGIEVTGANRLHLVGGLVRISADGVGTFASASAATGDLAIDKVAQNSSPALSNDGSIVYVAMNSTSGNVVPIGTHSYLVALDSTTLATLSEVRLQDPATKTDATVADISTASPTVGPDGDVYYGVLAANSENDGRGFLLHFSGDLKTEKTPGSFGWDDTASIVPASMVPSYHGTSSYLVMTKYNDYADFGGGTGINKIAVLDPNATQTDPITGIKVMKEVLTIKGPTPDPDYDSEYPGAVREWCVDTAAVDPATDSILVNNEDGTLYRWNLSTNKLSQKIVLTGGLGEAYTPTLIGPDGTVYAINRSTLWAVGD